VSQKPTVSDIQTGYNIPRMRGGIQLHVNSMTNEYQKHINNKVCGSKVRPVRRTDNLTAICEPIV
jgi:hypothetical protein